MSSHLEPIPNIRIKSGGFVVILWDARKYNENSQDEELLKSGSYHRKLNSTMEWLVDGLFFCCVDMNVLGYLLQVNSSRETCGVAFV